ncbi:MAG: hypothetical protein M0Z80_00650 [Treponema sp.]|nr:hypothetical protein [Treponema sp.]
MKRTKILAALLCLALLGLSSAGAQTKMTKPRASEVVIVARIQVSPAIDDDFFSHYAAFETPYAKATVDRKTWKDGKPGETMNLFMKDKGIIRSEQSVFNGGYLSTDFGKLGEVSLGKMNIPGNREIELGYVRVYLDDNAFFFFDVPIERKIVVPQGVNYVYLGTITCTLADEYFDIAHLARSDEFDGAQAYLNQVFGPRAQLVRVNLQELDVKKK